MKRIWDAVKPMAVAITFSWLAGFGGFLGIHVAAKYVGATVVIGYEIGEPSQ